jgi:hypothetical protein
MNNWTLLIGNLISLAFIILAGIMAMNDKPDWGWLIVCALLTFLYPKSSKSEEDNDKEDAAKQK